MKSSVTERPARLLFVFGPTSGSFPWWLFVLLDETAHAQLSQCLLRVAEIAVLEAVRPP